MKGQSLKQILLSHPKIEVSLKTLYTHVESSIFKDLGFDIYAISLHRQVANSANTYTSIAERYNLSVTKIQRFFDKSVNIKRKTLPEVLSIDEHYFPASNFIEKRLTYLNTLIIFAMQKCVQTASMCSSI